MNTILEAALETIKNTLSNSFENSIFFSIVFLSNTIAAIILIAISIWRQFFGRVMGGFASGVWSVFCIVCLAQEDVLKIPDGGMAIMVCVVITIFVTAFTGMYCAKEPS